MQGTEAALGTGMRSRSARALMIVATLAMTPGCAAPVGDEGLRENTLLSGRYTFDRPEVGSIRVGGGACTATLFGSARTVITAAHCVSYGTTRSPGNHGTFTLAPSEGESHEYTIRQYVSYGSSRDGSEADVALIQLDEPVPASVARPDPPPGEHPARGTTVAIYGYGCQNRGSQSGRFSKQVFEFDWGDETRNLCPGDSGGPTITPDGEVVTVNSAYLIGPGTDLFGDVVAYLDELHAQVVDWAEGEDVVWIGDSPGGGGGDIDGGGDGGGVEPGDRCAALSTCGACTGDASCGWCGRCAQLAVDESGDVVGEGCAAPVVTEPSQCGGGGGGGGDGGDGGGGGGGDDGDGGGRAGEDCGAWATLTEWTCDAAAVQFVRCGGRGLEFQVCPEGYYCPPGATTVECLWGDYGRR